MKKFVSIVLSAVMLVAMIPFTALPAVASAVTVASGDWYSEEYEGDYYSPTDVYNTGSGTWTLDDEGTLTVEGSGKLEPQIVYDDWSCVQFRTGSFPWTSSTYRSRIRNVVIGSGVTFIGTGLFGNEYESENYFPNLQSVTIPAGVTGIASGAFDNSGYSYGEDDGEAIPVIIYCYKNSAAHTYATEEGLPYALLDGTEEDNTVEGIAGRLDWSLNKLTGVLTITGSRQMPPFNTSYPTWKPYYPYIRSVVIGEGITTVSENAFSQYRDDYADYYYQYGYYSNKSRITSVQLPSTLQSIDKCAFYGLDTLQTVTIPDGVQTVGDYAFAYCTALSSVTLPDSVTDLGDAVFQSCGGLQSAVLSAGLTCIPTRTFYNCSRLTDAAIPAGVTSIESEAFYNCGLTSVELSPALQTVSDSAFRYSKLTSLTIPANVSSIGYNAFEACPSLQTVTFQNVNGCTVGAYAFQQCGALESVTFSEEGACSIGYRAFHYCTALTTVDFNLVRSVDTEAFAHCEALQSATLPGTMLRVSNRAFAFCNALARLRVENRLLSLSYSGDLVEYEGQYIQDMTTPVNTTIVCYADSTAMAYADAFNLRYVEIECAIGHTHNFLLNTVLRCGTSGIVTYVCEFCGKSYQTEETAAHSSHKLVFCPDPPEAGCGYTGSGVYACAYCDYSYEAEGALEHDYQRAYPNGVSCETFRDVTYTCARCGDTYDAYEFVDHDWESRTDLDEDGIYRTETMTCRRCEETHTYFFGPMHGDEWADPHNYTRKVIKAAEKCGEQDFVKYTCSECGYSYTQWEDSDALPGEHHYVREEPPVGTVCGERFTAVYVCEYCGDSYDIEETLEHQYSSSGEVCETICDVTYTCAYCGDSYTTENVFVDHDWESRTDWDEDDYYYTTTMTCRRCEETHTYHYGMMHGDEYEDPHHYTRKIIREAQTCGGQRFVKYTCSECGNSYTQWEDSDAVHSTHKYARTEPPVGTVCGERFTAVYVCEYCGDSYDIEETLDHKYISSGDVCETICNVTYTCAYCGDSYATENVFVDHDWDVRTVWHDVWSGTDADYECTKVYTCRRCGESHTYEFNTWQCDRYGHDYSSKVIKTAEKCGEFDFVKHTCTVCGYSYTAEGYSGALPGEHHYVRGETPVGTVCGERYTVVYVCEYCGDSYTNEETLDHKLILSGEVCENFCDVTLSCAYCGISQTHKNIFVDHNWEVRTDWDEDGIYCTKTMTCRRCGESLTYYYQSDWCDCEGHDYSRKVIKSGKCGESVFAKYTCTVCGSSYTDWDGPDYYEHEYESSVIQEGSGATPAVTRYTCIRCGDTYTRESYVDSYYDIAVDETKQVYVGSGCTAYFRFTPTDTADYVFYSSNGKVTYDPDSIPDTYGTLYNDDMELLASDDDSGNHGDFRIRYTLTAGERYLFGARFNYQWIPGYITVTLEKYHAHNYVGEVVTPSTCYEDGLIRYTCAGCGDTYEERIPAGHSYDDTYYGATCVTMGFTRRVCSVCGDEQIVDIVNATGHLDADFNGYCDYCGANLNEAAPTHTVHTYGDWRTLISATCVSNGAEIRSCYCGAFETRQTQALGHSYVTDPAVSPSCTEDGWTEGRHCETCGSVIREQLRIEATGHTPAAITDCTADTLCCVCGEVAVPAGTHTVAETPATEPTCVAAGTTAGAYCTVCGTVITAQEAIDPLGHDYVAQTVAPTCISKGYTICTCSRCHDSYVSDELAHMGHSFVISVTNATCTEPGVNEMRCTICGESYTAEIPAAGHNYFEIVVSPTCTAKGYTRHICTKCSDEYWDSYAEASGHVFYTTTVTPTCTENGCDITICSVCGYNYTDNVVSAPGHTIAYTQAIPATCRKTGLTEEEYCSVCKEILVPSAEIPCTEHVDGDGDHYCDDCGKYLESCDCICHKLAHSGNPIMKAMYRILCFFWKISNNKKTCPCGEVHW